MRPELLKYILDLESVIREIEAIKTKTHNDFTLFQEDIILQRAIERDLEIIGEAVRNILELHPSIQISSSKKMIGLRNIISHAYDSIEIELIWSIIQKDVPILARELAELRNT